MDSVPGEPGIPPRPGSPAAATPPVPDGLRLRPFPALRYGAVARGTLAELTSPPYDVLDAQRAGALAARNPHNVVRLTLPGWADPAATEPYAEAARLLARWRAEGVLVGDGAPGLYVYEECDPADGHVQRGLLGAVELARPDARIVLPHEDTMAGPVADRLALTVATAANLEPVFLVYDGGGPAGAAGAAVAEAAAGPPLVEGEAGGLHHRLWIITDPGVLAAIDADLAPRRAVIADGHHRYATYLRYQEQQHRAGRGPGPWDRGLALLVDAAAAGPRVGPIHRVLTGLPLTDALARAGTGMAVSRIAPGDDWAAVLAAADGPAFVLAAGSEAYLLTPRAGAALQRALAGVLDPARSPAWRGLEVTVAHGWLIPHVFGISDTEAAVGFEHDIPAALAAARITGGTALLLRPTPVPDVLAVAAAGERMPRKSTLFTPKPRSGLVLRALDRE